MAILITTQDQFADHHITKTFGLVQGNTVRSRNVIRNIMGSIRTLFGGEIIEFTHAVTEAREHALQRMQKEALLLGANGIVTVRFISSDIDPYCSEILVYGTAVLIEKHS